MAIPHKQYPHLLHINKPVSFVSSSPFPSGQTNKHKHSVTSIKQHPPIVTPIYIPNISQRPILPYPLPNTPVNGIACKANGPP